MKHAWASREGRGALVVAAGCLGVGFLPLFGPPGYEEALAAGLLVPSTAAIAVALAIRGDEGAAREPIASVGHGALVGLAYAGVAYLAALVHGLRVGFCDLGGGSLYFLLTAAPVYPVISFPMASSVDLHLWYLTTALYYVEIHTVHEKRAILRSHYAEHESLAICNCK